MKSFADSIVKSAAVFVVLLIGTSSLAFAQAMTCDAKIKSLQEAGVPIKLLNQMARKVKDRAIAEKEHVALIDYSLPSKTKRLFVINLTDGSVVRHYVSHGRGNEKSGKVTFTLPEEVEHEEKLPDEPGGHKVSLGLYHIAPQVIHSSKSGPALGVRGLDKVNRAAEQRRVYVQGCRYSSESFIRKFGAAGRSTGSFCVDPGMIKPMLNQLPGSLLYAGLSSKVTGSDKEGPELRELLRCPGTKRPDTSHTIASLGGGTLGLVHAYSPGTNQFDSW